MGSEELFLASAVKKHRFEMVGVMSDAKRDFSLALKSNQKKGFDFIKWADFGAEVAKANFIENPDQIQIPLTVLLGPSGVLKEWGPKASIDVILQDVRKILKLGEGSNGPVTGPENPSEGEGPVEVAEFSLVKPGRFSSVNMRHCSRGKTSSLEEVFVPSKTSRSNRVGFIYATKNGCGASCQSNQGLFSKLREKCLSRGYEGCDILVTSESCKAGVEFESETNFHKVFETHFNANYPADFSDYPAKLDSVTEDVLLGFSLKTGKLIFSHHDRLGEPFKESEFLESFSKTSLDQVAPSQKRQLFSGAGYQNLSDLFSKKPLTIILNVNYMCSGCIDELKHWTQPGELMDFCEESGSCQVYVADFEAPMTKFDNIEIFYDGILASYKGLGVDRLNLLVDGENEPKDRFYDSYIEAFFGASWDGLPGVSAFDQEGKIVYSAISSLHVPDPTLKFAKGYSRKL